jgi:hypothetical protein
MSEGEVKFQVFSVPAASFDGFGEEKPGKTAVDIMEGQGFDETGAFSQTRGENAEGGECHTGMLEIKALNVGFGYEEEDRVFFTGDGGGIESFIEAGDLGDRGSGALDVDHLLAAIGSDAVGSHGALDDDVETFGGIAGKEKDFALPELLFDSPAGKMLDVFGLEVLKQRSCADRGDLVECHASLKTVCV